MRPALERLPYFRFHSADYLIDTAGLTQAEHGAYILLIVNYYWNGHLPAEMPAIYGLAGGRDQVGREAVDLVLGRYFHKEDGAYVHHRIDRELAAYGEMIRTNSAAGKRSAEVRAQKAAARRAPQQANGHTKPQVGGFERFWAAYPRRVGKASAVKAWAKLAPSGELQQVISMAINVQQKNQGCLVQRYAHDGASLIPHPASWLNGRRWEDESSGGQREMKVAM